MTTSPTDREQLKPCPFCGATADCHDGYTFVQCEDCGARGASYIDGRAAAHHWNRRAYLTPADHEQLVARIDEALTDQPYPWWRAHPPIVRLLTDLRAHLTAPPAATGDAAAVMERDIAEALARLAGRQPRVTAPPAGEAGELPAIVRFLLGEAPFNGVWFGESLIGGAPFWWREHLRRAFASPAPVERREEEER